MYAMTHESRPRRLAAPAPERDDRPPRTERLEAEVHNLSREWAAWCRTRGIFGAPYRVGSQMRKLVYVSSGNERNARIDPQLSAFHLAVTEWPADYLPRRVFEWHYLRETERNVKRLAYEAGVSRRQWYRLVNAFARQAYARHHELRRA